jgi:hypothetical protein
MKCNPFNLVTVVEGATIAKRPATAPCRVIFYPRGGEIAKLFLRISVRFSGKIQAVPRVRGK